MKYSHIIFSETGTLQADSKDQKRYPGVDKLLEDLKAAGCRIKILTPADSSKEPEMIVKELGADKSDVLWIGSGLDDVNGIVEAGIDLGLTTWSGVPVQYIKAACYFNEPKEIADLLSQTSHAVTEEPWFKWAVELQFIGQAGMTYSKDRFDLERFERIREIAAEMMSLKTAVSMEKITDLFCSETGFQTPKMDTRAAIIEDDKILLVQENSGKWSLPGGWVDVNQSVKANVVKEVKEEAGLDVIAGRLVALHDRNRHNTPPYAYGICKVFVLCKRIGGCFEKNIETTDSGYFAVDDLPPLSEDKNTAEQIRLCFDAYYDKNWTPLFD